MDKVKWAKLQDFNDIQVGDLVKISFYSRPATVMKIQHSPVRSLTVHCCVTGCVLVAGPAWIRVMK